MVCHCLKQCEHERTHLVDTLLEAKGIYTIFSRAFFARRAHDCCQGWCEARPWKTISFINSRPIGRTNSPSALTWPGILGDFATRGVRGRQGDLTPPWQHRWPSGPGSSDCLTDLSRYFWLEAVARRRRTLKQNGINLFGAQRKRRLRPFHSDMSDLSDPIHRAFRPSRFN